MNTCIDPKWIQYLKESGSMIEYYQLQTAYRNIMNYEYHNKFKYDYVIKCRTDTIFCQKITFNWLNFTDQVINDRINTIRDVLNTNEGNEGNKDNESEHLNKIKSIFMNTLLYDTLPCKEHLLNIVTCDHYIENTNASNGSNILDMLNSDYINNGRYILTIRVNLLYICKRSLFNLIPSLGTFYGFLQNDHITQYWFNSEQQFVNVCINSYMSIYNYSTYYEEDSLYKYETNKYFSDDNEKELINKDILYLLIRH